MAYTDRLYDSFGRPKKRSAKDDLLKDVEDTFYGGGTAPAPTPTPTATPTTLAMVGQPTGILTNRQNAVSRVKRPVLPFDASLGSQYIGRDGTPLGPQYNDEGDVNPLPRGAVGIQGSQQDKVYNRTLNGSQPSAISNPTPERPMTPAEMAQKMIGDNLNAHGSLFGTSVPQQNGAGLAQPTTPETLHFLPPGFTAAVGSTGVRGSTENDIHFLPPGFNAISGTVGPNKQLQVTPNTELPEQQQTEPIRNRALEEVQRMQQGYGSAYGY